MSTGTLSQRTDPPTLVALSATAISLNVGLHETAHALTCVAVGSTLHELAALYVRCDSPTLWQAKVVDGVAPLLNLLIGSLLWFMLPQIADAKPHLKLFFWLFMLMNWLYGAGYLMVSGIANIGDFATVIAGWEPHWLWRLLLTLSGSVLFMAAVWLALKRLGTFIGGTGQAQFRLANRVSLTAYLTSVTVIVIAGLITPLGVTSLPVVAGAMAAIFGLSPLLWMMYWFTDGHFIKTKKPLLTIQRNTVWLLVGIIATLLYVVVLGRGIQL